MLTAELATLRGIELLASYLTTDRCTLDEDILNVLVHATCAAVDRHPHAARPVDALSAVRTLPSALQRLAGRPIWLTCLFADDACC